MLFLVLNGVALQAWSQEYFQQQVNYRILVTLKDKLHELSALETIEYTNHSPDSLTFLYFHLWPNGYANNHTELAKQLFLENGKQWLFKDPELIGYIDSLNFTVDGLRVQWSLLSGQPDICMILLNKSLKQGETIQIATPFHVKIPKGVTSRLGHIGDSFQISQWYPKPAVYDRLGWHQMSYQDQGEFYSEFGNFDVSITLPENYIVGATGNLQDAQEERWMDQLAAQTAQMKQFSATTDEFPPSAVRLKTIRFTENRVHDFAWFADKRFHVLKGHAKLQTTGKEITTWALFTNLQADIWKDATVYANRALELFSSWDGDYPYQKFTVVQSALSAGTGMEYPGITVIGGVKNGYALDEVIAHEAAHNWYYSAMGSNERRYPFMDEGITSANEVRYMQNQYPDKKLWEVYVDNLKLARFFKIEKMPVKQMRELEWLSQARDNLEQPINLEASEFTTLNYSLMIYNKAGMGFNYLRAYLGDSVYDSTMQAYFQQWKFKHPQPDDLCKLFESQTGKDLTWFFGDFISTTKRMDYKLVKLTNQTLLVKNIGELNSPLVISGMVGDSICFEKWFDGFEGKKWLAIPAGNYSGIKIDPRHITPELFRLNNNLRLNRIFPRMDPIQPQLYFSLEDPEKRHLMYFPAMNWTRENGFMLGLALHNGFLTPKPVEYFVMPFFAFGNSVLAGYGKITFNLIPYDKVIRKAKIYLEGSQYGAPGHQNYSRINTGFEIALRNARQNSRWNQHLSGNITLASDLSELELLHKSSMLTYLHLGYQLERIGFVNPVRICTTLEYGPSYLKTLVELNYRLSYAGKKNGLDLRLTSGVVVDQSKINSFYWLAPGSRSGREEYLFQGTYPDRFAVFPNSFWSRQMTITEGGLVSPVNEKLGYSRWLIALSVISSLPGKTSRIPVKPFFNLLLNDHGSGQHLPLFCEAGVKAGLWNFFEIWIPLLVSRNIVSSTGPFKDRIRLVFNLDSFSQTKLNSGLGIRIR